jgi:hypothetical protein
VNELRYEFDVDEIHEIRVKLAEEYANMLPEDAQRLQNERANRMERRIEELRKQKAIFTV